MIFARYPEDIGLRGEGGECGEGEKESEGEKGAEEAHGRGVLRKN
jgi:hypothetical protein